MPTVTAQQIVDNARVILQDSGAVRHPDAEMLAWVNEGQVEIAILRPDVSATTATLTLVAGAAQDLPDGAYALTDVRCNVTGAARGRAVRKVQLALLDSQAPGWYSATQKAVVKDWAYDERTPRKFFVYPPVLEGTQVEAVYSVAPDPIATIADVITIDDVYANLLTDYVLYRAFSKETELGLMQKAVAYRQAFENSLGLKAQADTETVEQAA